MAADAAGYVPGLGEAGTGDEGTGESGAGEGGLAGEGGVEGDGEGDGEDWPVGEQGGSDTQLLLSQLLRIGRSGRSLPAASFPCISKYWGVMGT